MGIEGGIGTLPLAVAESLRAGAEIVTHAPVTELRRTASDGWRIVAGDRVLHAGAVVVAVLARPAAELLRAEAPAAAAELSAVEYAFDGPGSPRLPPPGHGRASRAGSALVPPVDGRTIKASTFASRKGLIADEDPDLVVLRTSVGRYGETEILGRDDAGLVAVSRHDLGEATGLAAEPVATRVTRWQDGLPQYPVGHHAARGPRPRTRREAPGPRGVARRTTAPASRRASRSAYARPWTSYGVTRAAGSSSPLHPVQSLHGGAGE
ncbi:FAD-dependent oxidoreductase [Streptomyces thinghirensis]|nr:FAD-dependent oxidoreductase [Streptomyces thinghirensis]